MFFRLSGKLHASAPIGFPFPHVAADRRFARLMLRASVRPTGRWLDAAPELVDGWAVPARGDLEPPRVARPPARRSRRLAGAATTARLGPARISARRELTTTLCDGQALLEKLGVGTDSARRSARSGRPAARPRAVLESGERIAGARFVSTLPAEVYTSLAPEDTSPHLREIRYTAMISVVCATRHRVEPDFYWMNLASLDHTACGIFLLSSLNPTIGAPDATCVNFVTHLRGRDAALFARPDAEILAAYCEDYRRVFGVELDPFWHGSPASRCMRRPSCAATGIPPCAARTIPICISPAAIAATPRWRRRARRWPPASWRPAPCFGR
jgi:hypothetical protein